MKNRRIFRNKRKSQFPINLFCSLMLLSFIPFLDTLIRTNLIANIPSTDGLGIAGRKKSRGDAVKGNDEAFRQFMEKFHVITPIDPARTDLKGRTDILKKWEESVRAEAPYAYKDINEVIAVHKAHDMAAPVARLEPIFTVKS